MDLDLGLGYHDPKSNSYFVAECMGERVQLALEVGIATARQYALSKDRA